MLRVPLESIVRLLAHFAQSRGASTISVAQVNVLVAELLVGQRALWQAFVDGLVTQDEVLNAVLDRFAIAAFRAVESEPSSEQWAALREDLGRQLFPST